MCICDDDGDNGENELIIQLFDNSEGDPATHEMEIIYNSGGFQKRYASTNPTIDFSSGVWEHIAITHDGNSLDVYHNGLRIKNDNSFNIGSQIGSPTLYIGGHPQDPFSSSDFNGVIDDVRFLNYERQAFAGGLMINEVIPGSDTIRVYNSGTATMTLTGVEVWNDGTRCATLSGSLGAGAQSTSAISCTVGTADGIYLVDSDGDNSGGSDPLYDSDHKEWIIDGVCWNNDGETVDGECNGSSDPMIAAGVWPIGTAADMSEGGVTELHLIEDGDNDGGVEDWYVPEFGTLLMPVASVLLIVGYNYRRKNNLEA
jgi:hypothetical protein